MGAENLDFLQNQLITYIGNKRALLPFIGQAVQIVQKNLNKDKLDCLDIFAGSGIVARYLKQFSSSITVNDMELYSYIINSCYLSNPDQNEISYIHELYDSLLKKIEEKLKCLDEDRKKGTYEAPGFISELYAPKDEDNIQQQERCFYTPYNANYLDIARQLIQSDIPENYQKYFIAPLLSEASIHANTAGIFKGFYKNSKTGKGQFGGNGKNALTRIKGKISLPFPLFSNFQASQRIFNGDANLLVNQEELYQGLDSFDLAYFDPPYNQHPYGSNYFMLNLLATYKKPDQAFISRVSGIPKDWNRSDYNKKRKVCQVFSQLVKNVRAKYVLISFNSEGFISKEEMVNIISEYGKVQVLESNYNTFRGSRNLTNREIYVKEYLFLLEKNL
ncbi:MAG: DNA adenine methylase [Treponema sp.]|nr:DNA adenine methylase [Treponema sp.]